MVTLRLPASRVARITAYEVTDGTKLMFKVTNTYVAFQQPYFADPTVTVTYGSFPLASYDGTKIEIIDHDDEIVTFTGTIINDQLMLSGIDRIKWTDPPEYVNIDET